MILCKWEKIAGLLNPSNPTTRTLSPQCIQNLINESEEEQEKVRNALIEGLLERPNILDKREFVQVNQAMFIRLMDKIYSYSQKDELDDSISNVYHIIISHLKNTLNFIEDFFSNYFDRNEKIPATCFAAAVEELCKRHQILYEALESNTTIDRKLKNIISNNFIRFCNPKVRSATYNELIYQRDLLNELLGERTLESEAFIREVLFYLNFNDRDYVAYLNNKLTSLIESLPTKAEKISALRFEQKNINQTAVKLNCCLCCSMPSLKDQMNRWIEEEIKFLEAAVVCEKPQAIDEADDKIQTSLSVAKLALLIRLMVMDKIITNRVVAPVLRIVARIFTTLQKENIAFGSLETKYHNPDRGTISAVKDMLFRWVNILNKL